MALFDVQPFVVVPPPHNITFFPGVMVWAEYIPELHIPVLLLCSRKGQGKLRFALLFLEVVSSPTRRCQV